MEVGRSARNVSGFSASFLNIGLKRYISEKGKKVQKIIEKNNLLDEWYEDYIICRISIKFP